MTITGGSIHPKPNQMQSWLATSFRGESLEVQLRFYVENRSTDYQRGSWDLSGLFRYSGIWRWVVKIYVDLGGPKIALQIGNTNCNGTGIYINYRYSFLPYKKDMITYSLTLGLVIRWYYFMIRCGFLVYDNLFSDFGVGYSMILFMILWGFSL